MLPLVLVPVPESRLCRQLQALRRERAPQACTRPLAMGKTRPAPQWAYLQRAEQTVKVSDALENLLQGKHRRHKRKPSGAGPGQSSEQTTHGWAGLRSTWQPDGAPEDTISVQPQSCATSGLKMDPQLQLSTHTDTEKCLPRCSVQPSALREKGSSRGSGRGPPLAARPSCMDRAGSSDR